MNGMKLLNRTAVITGAGSGIGREMSIAFAREGAKIVVADISPDGGNETVRQVREAGGEAVFVHADVTNNDHIAHLVSSALDRFGSIDILCNNAGIAGMLKPALEVTEESWDRVISVNLKSVFMVSRAVIPVMLRKGKGVIINTASAAGVIASNAGCEYTAAKHGVIGLTKQLAFEYGKRGIRVVAISPGVIETKHTENMTYEGGPFHDLYMNAPAGRYGKPQEVARLAVFLASDDADFMHGCNIPIDGGSTIY